MEICALIIPGYRLFLQVMAENASILVQLKPAMPRLALLLFSLFLVVDAAGEKRLKYKLIG